MYCISVIFKLCLILIKGNYPNHLYKCIEDISDDVFDSNVMLCSDLITVVYLQCGNLYIHLHYIVYLILKKGTASDFR